MTRSWIFDVDGVITHLTEKKIIYPEILHTFGKILQMHDPLTLNTGRSLDFIRQEIFNPLLVSLKEQHFSENLLNNFFAVGEKGNAWIADEKDCFDTHIHLPTILINKVEQLIEEEFSDSMFFDTSKHTMISLEIKTKLPLHLYHQEQKKLLPLLHNLLDETNLSTVFHIDPSVSAVDIQPQNAGKGKGIQRIITWFTKNSIDPERYIAIGDSVADLEMGKTLQVLRKNFTFVFVGEKDLLKNQQITFPVTYTQKHFDEGTVEFLQQQLS